MSFWGWGWFYYHDDGPVGDVGSETPKVVRHKGLSAACFFLSLACLGAWGYLLWGWCGPSRLDLFGAALIGTVVYMVLGYLFLPKADESNLGLFGTVIDNPFRITDDINRFLLFLRLVLLPGRFLGASLLNPFLLGAEETQAARRESAQEQVEQAREDEVQAFLNKYGVNQSSPPESESRNEL